MSSITVDGDELKRVKSIRIQFSEVTLEYGKLFYTKRMIEQEIELLDAQFDDIDQKEQALIKELNDRYGVGNVNVETGEFTPESTE